MSFAADQQRSSARVPDVAKPVVNIAVITPKAGMFEEVLALQLAQRQRLRGKVDGLIGSRLFRSRDDRSLVIIAKFETAAAAERFREDPRFLAHLEIVQPLMESAAQGAYETAYEVGAI